MKLSKNKAGLSMGVLLALVHLVWLVLIATGVAQFCLDWVFKMHSLSNPMTILPLDKLNSLMLIVFTFVVGYILGWVFVLLHNLLHKK